MGPAHPSSLIPSDFWRPSSCLAMWWSGRVTSPRHRAGSLRPNMKWWLNGGQMVVKWWLNGGQMVVKWWSYGGQMVVKGLFKRFKSRVQWIGFVGGNRTTGNWIGFYHEDRWGGSIAMGVPQWLDGLEVYFRDNPNLNWRMARGTPIYFNPPWSSWKKYVKIPWFPVEVLPTKPIQWW